MSKDHKKDKKKKAQYETFRRGKDEVAPVLDTCLGWLERNAVDMEGLFRVSGAVREVEDLLKQFEKAQTSGKKVDLTKIRDPHVVAGVTKAWLRELSDPLLTFELYDCFVATASVSDPEARVACVARIISYLPPGNRATLKRLMQFLRLVEQNSTRNRMNASNLAICFAPNILRAKETTPMAALNEMQAANSLLTTMIMYFDVIFLKKEFPKASEALHKLPEKEKNDIEAKFRKGTIRLAMAETDDLFDDEDSESSGNPPAAPSNHAHHHHQRPALAGIFDQPVVTPAPSIMVPSSPRERAQAVTEDESNAKRAAAEKKETRDPKRGAVLPPVAASTPSSEDLVKADKTKSVEDLRSEPSKEPEAAATVAAPVASTHHAPIGGVRMMGAGVDIAAVRLKPRPAVDPSAPPVAKSADHCFPFNFATGATPSMRAQPKATLPPPVERSQDKRKSSEKLEPDLPPVPIEPLPTAPTPARPPSLPSSVATTLSATPVPPPPALTAVQAISTDDLPPIPDEPLPLPPPKSEGSSTSLTAAAPNSGSSTSPSASPRPTAKPVAVALPAPITPAGAPKSKLPSVRRAPPPVPGLAEPKPMPSPTKPDAVAVAAAPPMNSPKSSIGAVSKMPLPLVSPRAKPNPMLRELPPPILPPMPMALIAPSLLNDRDKDKEKEKDREKEKEREQEKDQQPKGVALEKLAEWLLDGRKDDVAAYLATLPEAEAKETRAQVKGLLALKLAELDTLG